MRSTSAQPDFRTNIPNLPATYLIKVLHKSNGGVSSARNTGIRIATGDYIVFVEFFDNPQKLQNPLLKLL